MTNDKMSVKLVPCILLKNEDILVTLESVKEFANEIVVVDPLDIEDVLQKWTSENNIQLHYSSYSFDDVQSGNGSYSFDDEQSVRNKLLKTAEFSVSDDAFLIFLDSGDVVRKPSKLPVFIKDTLDETDYVQAFNTVTVVDDVNQFKKTTIIRSNRGWEYVGVVRPYLHKVHNHDEDGPADVPSKDTVAPSSDSFQPKDLRKFKNISRSYVPVDIQVEIESEFKKIDQKELEAALEKTYDDRLQYMLAEVYLNNDDEKAIAAFEKRSLSPGKFQEEQFQSCLHLADLHKSNSGLSIAWNEKALVISDYALFLRAEPLVNLALIYKNLGLYGLAWMHIQQACSLPQSLVASDKVYKHFRFHVGSVVGFELFKTIPSTLTSYRLSILDQAHNYQKIASKAEKYVLDTDATNLQAFVDIKKSVSKSIEDYAEKNDLTD